VRAIVNPIISGGKLIIFYKFDGSQLILIINSFLLKKGNVHGGLYLAIFISPEALSFFSLIN
jgi:hypothetical protein